jgi:hypothetical protein
MISFTLIIILAIIAYLLARIVDKLEIAINILNKYR